MKLWLDDIRQMPTTFDIHAKTANEAINYLTKFKITDISLDHDLGDNFEIVGSGYEVAKWIEEMAFNENIHKINWNIHSANPVGRKRMEQALINADKYWNK